MRDQGEIGANENGGIDRVALTDADRQVRDWFRERMEDAELETRIDEMGNMFGRRTGEDSDADPILLGSHLDSQPNGGMFDGALGVISALEFVRRLDDLGVGTAQPIEIVNWTNEEGSRFQPAMMSSGVWTGAHDVSEIYDKTDENGVRFEEALDDIGYMGDVPAEPAEQYDSYLELHVEQGPTLDAEDLDVGIVTGIVGISWGAITFEGVANHTGTTPMQYRSDALVAAADVINQIRRLPATLGERTVASTGYVDVEPNSINVIPEEVTLTWDIRDPDDEIVSAGKDRVLMEAQAAADREGLDWRYEDRMRSSSVAFADRCVEAVSDAVEALGYDGKRMISGAGHDAIHMPRVCDSAMVFAVSEGGKSHSPDEYTSWDDCYRAANTLASAALELADVTDAGELE